MVNKLLILRFRSLKLMDDLIGDSYYYPTFLRQKLFKSEFVEQLSLH